MITYVPVYDLPGMLSARGVPEHLRSALFEDVGRHHTWGDTALVCVGRDDVLPYLAGYPELEEITAEVRALAPDVLVRLNG